MLLSDNPFNPLDALARITEEYKVAIDPSALKFNPLNLSREVRQAILNDAFARIQNE